MWKDPVDVVMALFIGSIAAAIIGCAALLVATAFAVALAGIVAALA